MRELICGTRGSKLAMIQTNWVIDELQKAGIKNPIQIKTIDTKEIKTDKSPFPLLVGVAFF